MIKEHVAVLDLIPQAITNKKNLIMSLTNADHLGPVLVEELTQLLLAPKKTRKEDCTVPWTRSMVMWVRAFFKLFDGVSSNMTKEFRVAERLNYCNMILGTTWSISTLRKVAKDDMLNMKLVEDTHPFKLNRETLFNDMLDARRKGYPKI